MNTRFVLSAFLFAFGGVLASGQAVSPRSALTQQINTLATTPKPASPALAANYGKLPLSFEANQGQADRQVKFLSRGEGYSLFLTSEEAVLALSKGEAKNATALGAALGKTAAAKEPVKTDVVRMQLAGADPGLKVSGADPLPGTANYFIGNDPAKWHSNVPTYSKVKYTGVYPGVDLVYYGNQKQLEYDFVVAPGANPKQVKLQFAGAKKLRLNSDGDLEVVAKNGEIAFHRPVVYQQRSGLASQREPVEGKFVLLHGNTVGFSLGNYDRSRELVIDPTLAYSTYLGGQYTSALAIAVDSGGHAYVTGYTYDPDFPTKTPYQGSITNTFTYSVAFVSKLSPGGDALVYSTYLGGTTGNCTNTSAFSPIGDVGNGIAVDASGNAYITGAACSTDFPTQAPFQSSNNGNGFNSNAFVTKLTADGMDLVYSTYLGGTGSIYSGDAGEAIAVDSSGSAYVTGQAYSAGNFQPTPLPFPTTPGAYQTSNSSGLTGAADAFITKFSPDGSTLTFSTYFGGDGGNSANAIAVDSNSAVYVTGTTLSMSLPATSGAYQTINNESGPTGNAYVVKLDPTGKKAIYASYLGGSGYNGLIFLGDIGLGIAVDSAGSAYVTGSTYSHSGSVDFPTTSGAFGPTGSVPAGQPEGFVTKFTPDGSNLSYSTFLGGNATGSASGIKVDFLGDAFVSGFTYATEGTFPVTGDAYQSANNGAAHGNFNAFLTELNPSASALIYSTLLGGSGNTLFFNGSTGDWAQALALDGNGGVYLAGFTDSLNFPTTPGSFQTTDPTVNSERSGFVAKFSFPNRASALQFIPVTPCRVADTRNPDGPFGGPELSAGASREFDIPQSACNIPSTAVAYSLNVTVVPNASLNYLTLWPSGQPQPFVSTLNSDGRVKANAAITPAGSNGGVSVFVSDASQVILDIDGYFAPAGTASALAFYPVTPCRIADTRNAAGALGGPFLIGNSSRAFPVQSSSCGLPSNAQAYSLNVTAVPHSTLNYLTTWPTGQPQPNVSTLNSSTGVVTANAAIVPAGTGGDVSIFVYDDADVILDVNGYFAPPGTGGLSLYTVAPCRVIDTRPTAFNGMLPISVEASACAPESTAQAYVVNATVVPPGPLNYLTLWPDTVAQPYVSTLNADDGAITSNMAIVPTLNGIVDAFAYNPTNLILDISSYFAP